MSTPVEEKPSPARITAYVKANAPRARKAQRMRHMDSTVVRKTDYKGHHIVVRTTYEVTVDGRPLMGHMGVNAEGLVHYHPVPNLRFQSALDMVKKVIDVFPDDFSAGTPPDSMPGMPGMGHGKLKGRGKRKQGRVRRTSVKVPRKGK